MFSCNQGRLVYKLLKMIICQSSGLCVLESFVWWYLYGKVFLSECLNMLVIYVVSLPILCECGPFMFECWRNLFSILLKVRGFLWMDWEGIIIKDIMDDVSFLVVFFIV